MKMLRGFFFAFFLLGLGLVLNAQDDQSGFISLDCGIPEGSNYTDERTGIHYISDDGFINTGTIRTTSPQYREPYARVLFTLRTFPQGFRNCYNLRPTRGKGNTYFIRARFMYGNYDNKGRIPEFDLYLGVNFWGTVKLNDLTSATWFETIHIPPSNYINVCLVNTGRGIPFISTLELRPFSNTIYKTVPGSLDSLDRQDFGSTSNLYMRYKDDSYDRMWLPFNITGASTIRTTSTIAINNFQVPPIIMSTANTPENINGSLKFSWEPQNSTDEFYLYMHFAEVQQLQANQSREFNIYLNEELWHGPYSPTYLSAFTVYGGPHSCKSECAVSINRTVNSTLPPIINAFEVYTLRKLTNPDTDESEVDAMTSLKSIYGVTKTWQGDPCAPTAYVWDGVNCSYDGIDSPRITSLNLSSSGLTGLIAPQISNLKMIESLDLSNNNLTGQVPDFLAQLISLKVLNLKGNNFTGSVPAQLLEKSKNGLLFSIESLENNTNPCQSVPCNMKKNKLILPIVASAVAASLVLLAAILVILWKIKRKKQRVVRKVIAESNRNVNNLEKNNQKFTYSDILSITNNLQRVIGKGGFGTVYHGYVGDTQVAVKMLSPSSAQGYNEFQTEASLLMSIHHKNLTSFVGYCDEGTNLGIIYEYMSNGNLDKHLSDKSLYVLSWEERLQIATDAAQGFEYLHHGCKPAIVHRDVKTTNILLNEKFQAKVADFGLSRVFPVEDDTHMFVTVAGTPGYLDPEYYTSNRLTEKSDVYGYGVVLLEIITGRPAIARTQDRTPIAGWVSSVLQNGDIKNIADPRLRGKFNVNSVWKAVELAMTCVSLASADRPTMNSVVMELKECLAIEMAHPDTEPNDSMRLLSINMESEMGPLIR